MVAGSALGFRSNSGGFGFLHARSGSALAVYVFDQVAIRDAMASANTFRRLRRSSGRVDSIAGGRYGRAWLGGGGPDWVGVGAAVRTRVG